MISIPGDCCAAGSINYIYEGGNDKCPSNSQTGKNHQDWQVNSHGHWFLESLFSFLFFPPPLNIEKSQRKLNTWSCCSTWNFLKESSMITCVLTLIQFSLLFRNPNLECEKPKSEVAMLLARFKQWSGPCVGLSNEHLPFLCEKTRILMTHWALHSPQSARGRAWDKG